MSRRPTTTDSTIPGTFRRPSPKVTSPSSTAAMATPGTVPDPPGMSTPPRTTIVTTSRSHPVAMEGRVLPSREVSQVAASPEARPARRNSTNVNRPVRMPENAAPTRSSPMA